MYVDRERIEANLINDDGLRLEVTGKKSTFDERDMEGDLAISDQMVIDAFLKESKEGEGKKNISDFRADGKHYIQSSENQKDKEKMTDDENKSIDKSEVLANRVRGLGKIGGEVARNVKRDEPVMPVAEPAKAVEMVKDRIEKRGATVAKFDPEKTRVSKEEINYMVKQNLVDYMLRNGAVLADPKQAEGRKPSNPDIDREWTLSFGKGQGCVVSLFKNDTYQFFMRDRSANGNIIDFKQWKDGQTYAEALHGLRKEFNTLKLSGSNALPSYDHKPKAQQQSLRQVFETALAEPFIQDKLDKVKRVWDAAIQIGKDKLSPYLTSRGITDDTQARLKDFVRIENPNFRELVKDKGWVSNINPNGILIKMADNSGQLTGAVRKGPKGEDGIAISRVTSNTQRTLVRLSDPAQPKAIVFGEAALDVVTIMQRDGNNADTLYIATAGAPSKREEAAIYDLARKNQDAKWVFVGQNDKANVAIEQTVKAAIAEGNPLAQIEVIRPKTDYKDFNDELMGKRTPEAAAREKQKQAMQGKTFDRYRNGEDKKPSSMGERLAEEQRRLAEEMRRIEAETAKNKGPRL